MRAGGRREEEGRKKGEKEKRKTAERGARGSYSSF
jgi:hypothetical protein